MPKVNCIHMKCHNLSHFFFITVSLLGLACVFGIEFWHLECLCKLHFRRERESMYLSECKLHWSSFFPPSLSTISLKQTHGDILILCLPIQIPLTAVSSQNMSVTKCQVSLACTWGSRGKAAVWPVRKPQPEPLQFCQTPLVGGSPQATVMTHRHTALSHTQ